MESEKAKENALKIGEDVCIETEDCNEVVSSFVLPKIPRPPNAFLLFAQDFRKKFSEQNPNETNKMISVRLGNTWRQLEKEQKEEYFARAKICENEHRLKYPEYQYNPFVARNRKRWMKDAKLKKQKQKSENNEGNKIGTKPDIQFNPSSEICMESLIKQPSELSHLQSHFLAPSASQCRTKNMSEYPSLNQMVFFDINSRGNKNSELQHIQNQRKKEDKFVTFPCMEGKCLESNSHQHLYIMHPVKNQTSTRESKKLETSDDIIYTEESDKDNEQHPIIESTPGIQFNSSLNKESVDKPSSSISSKLSSSPPCQISSINKSMNDQKSPLFFQSDPLIMKRVSNEMKFIDSKQICNSNKEERNKNQDEILYSFPCLDESCTDTRPHRHLYMMQPVRSEICKEESQKSEISVNQNIADQQITSNKKIRMMSTPMNLSPMVYAERNEIISHGLAPRPLALFPHQNMMRSEWSVQSQFRYPGTPLYHSVNPQLRQCQESSYYSPNYHRLPCCSYWSSHSPGFSHASPLGSYNSTYMESPIVHYSISPVSQPRYVNYNVLSESMNMLNYQSM